MLYVSLIPSVAAVYGLVEGLDRLPEEVRDRGAQGAGVFGDAAQFGDDVPHQHHRPQEHLIGKGQGDAGDIGQDRGDEPVEDQGDDHRHCRADLMPEPGPGHG